MKLSRLLLFLKCPLCQSSLIDKKNKLICRQCKASFAVVEGVPVLLSEDLLNKQEEEQKRWFNRHYSAFSKEEYKLENWRLSMLGRVFSAVSKKKVERYLDIGCGATGYTVIEAAKKNNWLGIGVDISLEAMLRAKNLAQKEGVEEKTAFVVCSAEKLPFKPKTFDYVSAVSVLEHLENDERTTKEVADVLRNDGYFFVCVPNTYAKMWPFLWPIYFLIDLKIGHKRHYSISQLNRKLENNCFELKDFFYNAHLMKLAQLLLEKVGFINDNKWWKIERKDFNKNSMGLQLNAVYAKTEGTNGKLY